MPADTGLKLRIRLSTIRHVVTLGGEIESESSLAESIDESAEDQRRFRDTAAGPRRGPSRPPVWAVRLSFGGDSV